MGLIVLEAALALAVLIFLIWWTMFSGRRGGELDGLQQDDTKGPDAPSESASPGDAQASERGGTRKDIG
jgi:hypothetical protein